MKKFNDLHEKDPLSLNQYDKRAGGVVSSKVLYAFLVLIPVFLLLTILFWFLSTLGGGSNAGANSDQSAILNNEKNIAKTFDQLQVGLRIMPSQNTEANIILMDYIDTQDQYAGNLNDRADDMKYYFHYAKTPEYFPVMRFTEDYVPLGNAKHMCIHLDWIRKDMRLMYDMYRTVQNFPDCKNAVNPKYRW